MGNLFWLSDEAWAVIAPHLPRASLASRASMIDA
jgi:transposase